jgi:hypothetical protein
MAIGTLRASSAAVFHSEGVSHMFQEEAPASSRGPDQVWFSMIMVNDPNAALFGSLRPSRPHPIVAALRRPFEALAPAAPRPVSDELPPALRPRRSRWVAAALAAGLVALGFGLTETVLEQLTGRDTAKDHVASAAPARLGSTILAVQPASRATRAGSSVASTASAAAAPSAVRESLGAPPIPIKVAAPGSQPSVPAAVADATSSAARATSGRSTTSVKKKAAARQRKAALGRALAARKAARR